MRTDVAGYNVGAGTPALLRIFQERENSVRFIHGLADEHCDDFFYRQDPIELSNALPGYHRPFIHIAFDRRFAKPSDPKLFELKARLPGAQCVPFHLGDKAELEGGKVGGPGVDKGTDGYYRHPSLCVKLVVV